MRLLLSGAILNGSGTFTFPIFFREGNNCADWLVKYDARGDDRFQVLLDVPEELAPLLMADVWGGFLHQALGVVLFYFFCFFCYLFPL